MLPVVALLGRPNVGKSTLFNQLTGTRDALVANYPGLTRDRQYGIARLDEAACIVIDTGGLTGTDAGLDALTAEQSLRALAEADAVMLLVDARDGPTAIDAHLVDAVRRSGKPAILLVNKVDGVDATQAAADFHALGLAPVQPIVAAQGRGVRAAAMRLLEALPPAAAPAAGPDAGVRIAVVGRPNVGKSTLTNRLLGEARMVVSDVPGTTRDAIAVPFSRDGRHYTLIDTAGIRRRARVHETVEKFSIVKTLQAVDAADVALLLLDAHEGVTDQDASLAGLLLQHGRAIVIAVNKWDGLSAEARERLRGEIKRRLPFLDFVRVHRISALHGTGVGELLGLLETAAAAAAVNLPTSRLSRILADAVAAHPPPLVRGRRVKLRYAHQGGRQPPVIVIHGNQTDHLPGAYRRYLNNAFREALGLQGTPIVLELRTGENPYAGRRNPLTPRQQAQRKRLIKRRKS